MALRTTSVQARQGMFDVREAVLAARNSRNGFPHCLRIDLQRDRHMRRKYILATDTEAEMDVGSKAQPGVCRASHD